MPSWFSKVFKDTAPTADAAPAPVALQGEPDDYEDDYPEPRRVVQARVLVDDEQASAWSPDIQIKARYSSMEDEYTLMVDRPLLEGHSFLAPDAGTAYAHAPLAGAIFDLGGVRQVLIHEMTVTVTKDGTDRRPWEEIGRELGAQIRAHLKSGLPVVAPDFLAQIPAEEIIRERLQAVIDQELNPGIASHSGVIILNRVKGNTAYITMGGGCQGCAASSITLRGGVEQVFRQAVPELGAILDETDHASGSNPYFRELPTGMGA